MENIAKVERLNSIRNEMTHLWGSVFVIGGGSVSLLLSDFDITRLFLAIWGIIFAMIMFNAYFIRRNEVIKILKTLKEEE